ncbi:MBL fold metallo-hydrolase [Tessaracoccus coleopterorum]|uniref:hypothetical protein n=1 Tax=Tessaracoccus coleopterorum TaxID=2714950 RepID=UPI002F91A7B7
MLLTHAHADHSSYLPALVKHGFNGPILATGHTVELAEIVLRDAGRLQEQATDDARRGGWSKHADPVPLYTTADVEATLPLFREVDFDTNVDIEGVAWARWVRAAISWGRPVSAWTSGRRPSSSPATSVATTTRSCGPAKCPRVRTSSCVRRPTATGSTRSPRRHTRRSRPRSVARSGGVGRW